MGILDFVVFLGGVGLFLYGIKIMGQGLEMAAGSKLKSMLDKVTSNKFMAVLIGVVGTGIIAVKCNLMARILFKFFLHNSEFKHLKIVFTCTVKTASVLINKNRIFPLIRNRFKTEKPAFTRSFVAIKTLSICGIPYGFSFSYNTAFVLSVGQCFFMFTNLRGLFICGITQKIIKFIKQLQCQHLLDLFEIYLDFMTADSCFKLDMASACFSERN